MTYFLNLAEIKSLSTEKYVEFKLSSASKEFLNENSLYMLDSTRLETGFNDFWVQCMCEDLVFDLDSIYPDDLAQLNKRAVDSNKHIIEITKQLTEWFETNRSEFTQCIYVIYEYDRLESQAIEKEL